MQQHHATHNNLKDDDDDDGAAIWAKKGFVDYEETLRRANK